jgi:hypothetical protein
VLGFFNYYTHIHIYKCILDIPKNTSHPPCHAPSFQEEEHTDLLTETGRAVGRGAELKVTMDWTPEQLPSTDIQLYTLYMMFMLHIILMIPDDYIICIGI